MTSGALEIGRLYTVMYIYVHAQNRQSVSQRPYTNGNKWYDIGYEYLASTETCADTKVSYVVVLWLLSYVTRRKTPWTKINEIIWPKSGNLMCH